MKICVVNYSSQIGWYPFGQRRLSVSLSRVGFEGSVYLFDEDTLACPLQKDVPYAFKIFALREMKKKKYDLILWVDASFWAIRSLSGLFSLIERKSIVVQNSGYPLGMWSSDISLNHFGIDREKSFKIPMYSGGLIGLDLRSEKASRFLDNLYKEVLEEIAFKGAWSNRNQEVSTDNRVKGHRHDMVVGSILANRAGVEIQPNNSLFAYYGWYEMYKRKMNLKDIRFVCEGGMRKPKESDYE